jgi:hypothetical protein
MRRYDCWSTRLPIPAFIMRVRRHVVLAALMAAVPGFAAAQRPAKLLNRSTVPATFPMLVYQALTEAR